MNAPAQRTTLSVFERALLIIMTVVLVTGFAGQEIADRVNQELNDWQAGLNGRKQARTGDNASAREAADGKSGLPGGAARFTYRPQPGQYEVTNRPNGSSESLDGATWWLALEPPYKGSFISLSHHVIKPAVNTPELVRQFVAFRDDLQEADAGRPVPHKRVRVDGRIAYVWEFTDPAKTWIYRAMIPGDVHSFDLQCKQASSGPDYLKRQCSQAFATLDIQD